MKRYDLNFTNYLLLATLAAFFGIFLIYPIGYMLRGAFFSEGNFSLQYFEMLLQSPLQRESLRNSFAIGILTTLITTLIAMPIAHLMVRYDFFGKSIAGGLILVPMIMPPFVGAIGLKQLLAKYGSLNLFLIKLGFITPTDPIDWFGEGGFWGIVILQVLSL